MPLCQCFLAGKPGRLSPHLTVKLHGPGGAKAIIIADSLLMKQQLLIKNRSRQLPHASPSTGRGIRCRPIGVLKMTDESGDDAKVLAVPIDRLCKAYRQVHDFRDLSPVILDQIAHFFEHYKDLDEGKWVRVEGWSGVDDAKQEILDSVEMYKNAPEKPHF